MTLQLPGLFVPRVLWFLRVLRGANAQAGEAFALSETPL